MSFVATGWEKQRTFQTLTLRYTTPQHHALDVLTFLELYMPLLAIPSIEALDWFARQLCSLLAIAVSCDMSKVQF